METSIQAAALLPCLADKGHILIISGKKRSAEELLPAASLDSQSKKIFSELLYLRPEALLIPELIHKTLALPHNTLTVLEE